MSFPSPITVSNTSRRRVIPTNQSFPELQIITTGLSAQNHTVLHFNFFPSTPPPLVTTSNSPSKIQSTKAIKLPYKGPHNQKRSIPSMSQHTLIFVQPYQGGPYYEVPIPGSNPPQYFKTPINGTTYATINTPQAWNAAPTAFIIPATFPAMVPQHGNTWYTDQYGRLYYQVVSLTT